MPKTPRLLRSLVLAIAMLGGVGLGGLGCSLGANHSPDRSTSASQLARDEEAPAELDMSGGAGAEAKMAMNEAPSQSRAAAPPAPGKPAGDAAVAGDSPAEEPSAAQGRELIRRAELNLNVPVVADAAASVQALAKRMGGFVGDMRWEAAEGGRPNAELTVRVPARRFDAFVDAAGAVGRLEHKSISAEDVTAEVVDSKARVRNLKAEESRLVELLKRAGKLSEVLEVEREIARVRGEVESIQARLRELGNLVGLATVKVRLSERLPTVETTGWALGDAVASAWREATADLGRSLRNTLTTAIRVVVVEGPNLLLALLGAAFAFFLAKLLVLAFLVKRGPQWPASRASQAAWALGTAALVASYPGLLGLMALAAFALGLMALTRWAWPKASAALAAKPAPPAPSGEVTPPAPPTP